MLQKEPKKELSILNKFQGAQKGKRSQNRIGTVQKKKSKTKMNKLLVSFFVKKFVKSFFSKKSDEFLDEATKKKIQKEREELIYSFLGEKDITKRTRQDCIKFGKIISVFIFRNHFHFAQDVKFLKKYKDRTDFPEICQHMQLETYKPKTAVIQQGGRGDKFYIILKGKCGVFIDKTYDNLAQRCLEKVVVLQAGSGFGEMALLHDSKRSASIITECRCDLITLDRKSFQKYIGESQDDHLNQMINFYKSYPFFEDIPQSMILQLAASSVIIKYPSSTLIFQQNDAPAEFVFIKTGNFKLMRKINFKVNPISKIICTDDFSEPTEMEKRMGYFTEVLLELDLVGKNFCLCDYEIFNNEKMHYSAMSCMPCQIIKIPNYSLKSILKGKLALKLMKNQAKPYPPDTFIRKQFIEIQKWDLFKHQQIMNTLINKKNERNNSGNVWRTQILPELEYNLRFGDEDEEEETKDQTLEELEQNDRYIDIQAMKEGIEDWANREKILPSQRYRQDVIFEGKSHQILRKAFRGQELEENTEAKVLQKFETQRTKGKLLNKLTCLDCTEQIQIQEM